MLKITKSLEITDFVITFADKYTIYLKITFINHPLKITTMAKGNMLLGYSRGSVGDVTFYRSGGSQRARARNRNPNNPRTRSQQTQRAIFSNAVKFYKLCVTNFFKFAYENKKPNESDYNAYMRENVARSCMMSRTAYYCEPYPALGNWLVTRGTLQTINNVESDNTKTPKFSFGVSTSATFDENTPIATISNILLQSSEYQVGDIITILEVDTMPMEAIPTATPDQTKYSTGTIVLQFIVNPNNVAAWKTVYSNTSVRWSLKAQNGNLALYYGATEEIGDELWVSGIHQFAVIHSRNTSEGLKVSTQEIIMNPRAITAFETALSNETYKSAVLADWAATPNAILQGSVATAVEDPMPFITSNEISVECGPTAQGAWDDPTEVNTTSNVLQLTTAQKYINSITNYLTFDTVEHAQQAYLLLGGTSGTTSTNLTFKPFLFNYNYVNFTTATITLSSSTVRISANAFSVAEIEMFTNGGGLNVSRNFNVYSKQWIVRVSS